ncbi:MAG: TolC family protein [Candidatus Omnitrophica bacterium]|nr:TolC family protein [Candidatus Omnitrophota bacterium]
MTFKKIFFLTFFILIASSVIIIFIKLVSAETIESVNSSSLNLDDCYKLALKQSETLAINREKIIQAEAHFLQALGTALPQVSLSRTDTRHYSDNSPSSNKSFEQKFIFTQQLFAGFKEFAAISGSHLESKQRRNEQLRAEQILFENVSDAFYLLVETRDDLKILKTIHISLNDRVKDLSERFKLGKSRKSEVVNTEVQLYNTEADIETAKNQEMIAKELLEFLTGQTISDITDTQVNFILKSETEYMNHAATRADVKAADYAWKVSQKQVAIARSGFFPTVNLEGDYYTHRTSSPVDSDWSTLLTVSVPIFKGTSTMGNLKEANSIAKQYELYYNLALRNALQDIHDAYTNVQFSISRSNALAKALESAELDFKLQTQDYASNLVNNLDVLTAIQDLAAVKRNYSHTAAENKRFYWQLLVASGDINLGNK